MSLANDADLTTPAPAQTPAAALTEPGAAHYLGYSRGWFRKQRLGGTGPAYIRVGRSIRYRVKDLDLFLEQHRVQTEVR
jgi:hypothetical protein